MSKNQKQHYIIQFSIDGQWIECFWAGMNNYTDQWRKAKMYNSTRYAHEAAHDAIKNVVRTADNYRLIVVEICQTGVIESDGNN